MLSAEPDDDTDDDGLPDPWTDGPQPEPAFEDPEEYPPPPWTDCGTEWVALPRSRGDGPRWVESERWIDRRGRPVNELDMYRWREHLRAEHEWATDIAEIAEVEADMARQRAEWAERERRRVASKHHAAD